MAVTDEVTQPEVTQPETAEPAAEDTKRSAGGVQSIERAFTILEALAGNGGVMGLSALAAESKLPLPTIHRLARTLVDLGYLRQEPSRQYALGPRILLLAESSSTMLSVVARPHLTRLVDELGETANLASLDGDQIVYISQVPSRHSMRMFTEVGRRVLPHCTAVGKAIMAGMPPGEVRDLLQRTGMPRHTEHTITDPDTFAEQLRWSADHGYAIDDGEQELGVRCVAVAVPGVRAHLALSVSGPAGRMSPETVDRAVPLLTAEGAALAAELT
jgi:IclR family acetate operon transcriptional repressor